MNDLNEIVIDFIEYLSIDTMKESVRLYQNVARDFKERLEDEPFICDEIGNMVEEYLEGDSTVLHPCILLPVVERKLKYGSSNLEILRLIWKSWNTEPRAFFMLVINPSNMRLKNDISEYFYKVCKLLIPTELDEIIDKAQSLISDYNLKQIEFNMCNTVPLSKKEINNLQYGDIILFKEKYKNFEVYLSGIVGKEYNSSFVEMKYIVANDMFEGNRGTQMVNSEDNEIYLLASSNIKSKEFKRKYIKEKSKVEKEDLNDTQF